MTSMKKNKVVLGLSGGVDSTAAALLLQEKGYQVTGLYFSVKDDEAGMKRSEETASQLGIELICRDMSRQFEEIVIGNFCSEYMKGRTPNPCIICNPNIKFKALTEAADEIGAYYIATGHYADTFYEEDSGRWYVRRAANEKKDQSYMLYRLGQEVISRLLLPLNHARDKDQIRDIARQKAMKNAEARDSQEICFIDSDDNYKAFLNRRGITAPAGSFTDSEGNVLGRHQGILNYTIGQRKGLGIALGKPAFVTAIDSENNRVVLGDNDDLFSREVISDGNILLGVDLGKLWRGDSLTDTADAENEEAVESAGAVGFIGINDGLKAKIRYAAKPADARIELLEDGRIRTVFKEPQRAATPGQSIVFYQDDLVIGGGFIS